MSKRALLITLGVLVLLGAGGFGGWWYAADQGLIPGKANSPRPENFKAALDEYFARTSNPYSRNCAALGYSMGQRQTGYPDTAFDWTPAGFLARPGGELARQANLAKRLPLLAKHGLLQARKGEGGADEYAMTWQGYAASGGNGCFYLTSGERVAKVLAGERVRVANGVEIYEVVARPLPKAVEPWAADPDFKDAFDGQNFRTMLEPEPATYELARGAAGFTVIGEKSRQGVQPRQPGGGADAAVLAQLMGPITPARVMEALQAYLQKMPQRQQVCVELPQQGEADESTVHGGYSSGGAPRPPVTVTFYNLVERRDYQLAQTLRAYEVMKRLESLGMAKSELIGVAEWQGRPASGAVRYELTEAAMARLSRTNPRCLPVGELVPEAVVSVHPFTEQQARPRFFARARLKADEEAKPLLAKFAHFARMADPGAAMQGTLRYQDGQLVVESVQTMQPRFHPETADLRLPIVEPPKPVAPPPGKGGAPARISSAPARDVVFAQAQGMSTLSNGGLTMTYCCAGASTAAYSDIAQLSGKWYAELTLRTRAGATSPDTWTNVLAMPQPRPGGSELMMAAAQPGALGRDKARYRSGDVIGVAVDADTGRAWYSVNGDWMNGTPGMGGGAVLARGLPLVVVATSSASSQSGAGNDAWTANFGKTRFRGTLPRGFRSWDGRQSN